MNNGGAPCLFIEYCLFIYLLLLLLFLLIILKFCSGKWRYGQYTFENVMDTASSLLTLIVPSSNKKNK